MGKRWILVALSLFLHSILEGAPGHVFGMVLYQRHQPLAGVRVRLSREEKGVFRETTTDEIGYFRFRWLPAGIYSLELELSGFAYAARRDFDVVSRMTSNFDVDMHLAVGESVLFAGQVPLIAPGEVPERLLRHRAFLEALERGDIDEARGLLPGGVELSHGQAALGIAARSGNDAMLDFLLDAGADPNARANEKWTALMAATRAGRTNAVRMLLRAGADRNVRASDGAGLVELAAARRDPEVLDLLLTHGANVDARDPWGRTALFHLARDSDAAELLLSAGAEIDARDANGETPLMRLVRSLPERGSWLAKSGEGWLELSRLLAAGADPDLKNDDGETALLIALGRWDERAPRELVLSGATLPERRDGETRGFSRSFPNVRRSDVEALAREAAWKRAAWEQLLERERCGAETAHATTRPSGDYFVCRCRTRSARTALASGSGESERTALMEAAAAGDSALVRLLLNEGQDPNARDEDERTALLAAVVTGHGEILRTLLAHGANGESALPGGPSALFLAAAAGSLENVRLLLDHGVDPSRTDDEGRTAAMIAALAGHENVARFLRDAQKRLRRARLAAGPGR